MEESVADDAPGSHAVEREPRFFATNVPATSASTAHPAMGWTKERAAGATNISKPRKIRPAVVCVMAIPMSIAGPSPRTQTVPNGKFKPDRKMPL